MAQLYSTVGSYVVNARTWLQDRIQPYRYADSDVVDALNSTLAVTQRIRADLFLDLKYQTALNSGDLDDGFINNYYTVNDLVYQSDGVTIDPTQGTIVPIPSKYHNPISWYMAGHLQIFDTEDTTDQRAVAFMTKFQSSMTQMG